MGGAGQVMKRIPRINFPQRHPKPTVSAVRESESQPAFISSSDVPAAPTNTAVGGKACLQPKRTAVSEREIEAILLGGCF